MFGNLRSLAGFAGIESLKSRLPSWHMGAERREGERLFEESDYDGAELHLASAVLESDRRQESAHHRILLRLELAEAQRRQYQGGGAPQKLADAEETVRSAFELASRVNNRDLIMQTLDQLVTVVAERGDLDEVESLMRELGALEAKERRSDPLQRATRLNGLGLLRQRHGKLSGALEALAESAAIHEQVLGDSHPSTAHQLSRLGAAQSALGNHSEGQRCLRRSIRIHEQHGGLDSPEAVEDLHLLAASLEAAGDIDGAAAEFERVLALKLRMTGQDLCVIAAAQRELALRYLDWRRHSRARELLTEAAGTLKRTGGAPLARVYEALAQVEEDTGHYHEALQELARAGEVWDSVQSEHPTELIANLEHGVFLFDLLGEREKADCLRAEAAALAARSA